MCCSGQRVNADRQTKWFVCFGIEQISIRHPHFPQRKIKNLTAVRRLLCSPAWSITSPPSWWFETYQIKCGRVAWQQCGGGGLMMIGATEHGIPHPGWPLLHHTGILPDHNLIRSFVDGCLCISTIFKFNWTRTKRCLLSDISGQCGNIDANQAAQNHCHIWDLIGFGFQGKRWIKTLVAF